MTTNQINPAVKGLIDALIFDLTEEKDFIATVGNANKLHKMFAKKIMKSVKNFIEYKDDWHRYETYSAVITHIFWNVGELMADYASRQKINDSEIIKAVKDYDLWDEAFTLLGFGDNNEEEINKAYSYFLKAFNLNFWSKN